MCLYLGVLLIVCDSEAIRHYEERKLGSQLVDVITVVLVPMVCTWLLTEGRIIFIQYIHVAHIWLVWKSTLMTALMLKHFTAFF